MVADRLAMKIGHLAVASCALLSFDALSSLLFTDASRLRYHGFSHLCSKGPRRWRPQTQVQLPLSNLGRTSKPLRFRSPPRTLVQYSKVSVLLLYPPHCSRDEGISSVEGRFLQASTASRQRISSSLEKKVAQACTVGYSAGSMPADNTRIT